MDMSYKDRQPPTCSNKNEHDLFVYICKLTSKQQQQQHIQPLSHYVGYAPTDNLSRIHIWIRLSFMLAVSYLTQPSSFIRIWDRQWITSPSGVMSKLTSKQQQNF